MARDSLRIGLLLMPLAFAKEGDFGQPPGRWRFFSRAAAAADGQEGGVAHWHCWRERPAGMKDRAAAQGIVSARGGAHLLFKIPFSCLTPGKSAVATIGAWGLRSPPSGVRLLWQKRAVPAKPCAPIGNNLAPKNNDRLQRAAVNPLDRGTPRKNVLLKLFTLDSKFERVCCASRETFSRRRDVSVFFVQGKDDLMRFKTISLLGIGLFGLGGAAHAEFIVDPNCSNNSCPGGEQLFIDTAVTDQTVIDTTVGSHTGPEVTVTTVGPVDSGAGFANFSATTAVTGSTLVSLTFTPGAPNTDQFSDFDFRGQMEPGFTGTATIDVNWVGSLGPNDFGTIQFSVDKANQDFGAFGIINNNDGDFLQSVAVVAVNPADFKEVKQIEFSFGEGTSVPEPSSIALLGVGLLGLGFGISRSRKAS